MKRKFRGDNTKTPCHKCSKRAGRTCIDDSFQFITISFKGKTSVPCKSFAKHKNYGSPFYLIRTFLRLLLQGKDA
jgi:hypothetical protein